MANKLVTRPARKKTESVVPALKPAASALDIKIDYPKEEELIVPGHYAVRLSGTLDAQVELSINGGDWHGCRSSLGHYWFDWAPSDLGETVIKARLRIGNGRWKTSDVRFCRVVNSKKV